MFAVFTPQGIYSRKSEITQYFILKKMNQSNSASNILLGLATAPLLVALVGGRAVARFMMDLSRASEEVFRGDRLPILDPPPGQSEE
jgi:hypothetical protein